MTNYQKQYNEKQYSIFDLASKFQSGWTCVSDIALTIPYGIYNEVEERIRKGTLSGITMHTMIDSDPLYCYNEEAEHKATGISWFTGAYARKGINSGHGDVMPCYYRDMPSLFYRYIAMDAYCAMVSPMDEHGYFSTFNGSNGAAMLAKAQHIFLEVNEHMPHIPSSTQIHISQVTALCENHKVLPQLFPKKQDEISTTIGNLIAEEIPNEATFQLGIGAIPEAVGCALKDKHNLGIHTELFTDSMMELIESGVVTNRCKPIHTGRSVATFAFGTQKMYNFLHNNPTIDMLPVSYTNNPKIIAQHPNMMSVNAGLEVDFYGQVCAESIGTKHFSGTGGQVDYVRGAVESQGGKSFIAFPSTTKNDTISRIKPTLTQGAIVTTSKNDVDYIVTEYGIAKLRGRTLSQRTHALISIAHPKFREELTCQAKRENIII